MTGGHATADPTTRKGCAGCGEHQHDNSPCRCCEKHAPTCELECLERPLFTCGMVLSDSDLTALVDWTRARFALRRHVDGWGVVCGFDVRCDPDRPGWVVVEPGYAVSCCGEDILACAPVPVDLTGCCADDDPCGEPSYPQKKHPCGDFVVDLELEAEEVPAVTELVDPCGCGGGCSSQRVMPTRMREGARVRPLRVSLPDADPLAAAAEDWRKSYAACHAVVTKYVKEGVKDPGARGILAWLAQQKLDPPCNWWDATCQSLLQAEQAMQDASKPDENGNDMTEGTDYVDAALARAFLELVVSCRQRLLRRACEPCASGNQLRLARVWLRRPDADRKEKSCVVVRIDAYAPYRRELAPFARPMPAGATDLTPFIWQRWEQVCGRWRDLTHDDRTRRIPAPEATSALGELLDHTQWVSWTCQEQEVPMPVVVTTDCLGDRVLGFTRRSLDETKRVPQDAATAADATAAPGTDPALATTAASAKAAAKTPAKARAAKKPGTTKPAA